MGKWGVGAYPLIWILGTVLTPAARASAAALVTSSVSALDSKKVCAAFESIPDAAAADTRVAVRLKSAHHITATTKSEGK